MSKYKALIIDDEPIARGIIETHVSKINEIEIVASCKNAIEGFSILNKENIDLIFLDINMPNIDGISFAKTINPNIKVIFTTAYREYAIDGFDLQAVDYLLKPISFIRLNKAVSKFIAESTVQEKAEIRNPENLEDFFFIRADRKMIKVDFNKILFIESLGDYLKINLADKTITTRETITNIEAKLPPTKFLRCHRSFIVAIEKIEYFTHEYIQIRKQAITISRSYKDCVIERLGC